MDASVARDAIMAERPQAWSPAGAFLPSLQLKQMTVQLHVPSVPCAVGHRAHLFLEPFGKRKGDKCFNYISFPAEIVSANVGLWNQA